MEVDHDEHTSVISETFGQEWQEHEDEGLDTSIDQDYINGLVFFSVKVCKLCAHGPRLSVHVSCPAHQLVGCSAFALYDLGGT